MYHGGFFLRVFCLFVLFACPILREFCLSFDCCVALFQKKPFNQQYRLFFAQTTFSLRFLPFKGLSHLTQLVLIK